MNANGQAVGNNLAGEIGNYPYATLWTKTGSNWGSYTATDLVTAYPAITTLYPGLNGCAALAINSSGVVVLGVNNQGYANWSPNLPGAYYTFNESTDQYTSLGSLEMYDPVSAFAQLRRRPRAVDQRLRGGGRLHRQPGHHLELPFGKAGPSRT